MKLAMMICLIIAFPNDSRSQISEDLQLTVNIFSHEKRHVHYEVAKNNLNEIQFVFSGMFLFYKSFFSSQDEAKCSFTPSCSEYAMYSLKKHGLIIGVMAACDRLLRCNGLSPENYEIDFEKKLLIDLP